MKLPIIFIVTHLLIINAITVPPVWPKSKARYKQKPQFNRDQYQNHKNVQANTRYNTNPTSPWLTFQPQTAHIKLDTPQNFYGSFNSPGPARQVSQYRSVPTYIRPQVPQKYVQAASKPQSRTPKYKERPRTPEHEDPQSETYVSPLETPRDVPTRPIYPGAGQWAKPGIKHTPYIHKPYEPVKDDTAGTPEGYETFEFGQKQFENAQTKFKVDLKRFPKEHRIQEYRSNDEEEADSTNEEQVNEFVPMKLYAQVRRTESEQHLPRSEIGDDEDDNSGRLRKILRDSRIHTVYTEEGYEDAGYDHAGHEKNAQNSEGHSELSEGEKKSAYHGPSSYNVDTETAGSSPLENKIKKINRINMSKDMTQTILKNTEDAEMGMEIHTEVKISGPDKKKHKYIKIVPSYKKIESNFERGLSKRDTKPTVLKRVKRYNRQHLSQRYVRRRPNYYWKKNKSSSANSLTIGKFSPKSHSTEAVTQPTKFMPAPKQTTIKPTVQKKFSKINPTTEGPPKIAEKPAVTSETPLIRSKRYTIDHPNIGFDLNEFVDVKTLTYEPARPDLTHLKYPYYTVSVDKLHENSPLRYAEDLKNIPDKSGNEMAFYESRNHIKCQDIPENIDPIPEHIRNKGEGVEEDEEETAKVDPGAHMPKLQGLNDKIDCYKLKYFGENPLDSPFFKEEVIQPPIPIFNRIHQITNDFVKLNKQRKEPKIESTTKLNIAELTETISIKNTTKRNIGADEFEPIVVDDDESVEKVTINPIHEEAEAVLKPPYTLTEMVDKIEMTRKSPKNIYDTLSSFEDDSEYKQPDENDSFIIVYSNKDSSNESAESKREDLTDDDYSEEQEETHKELKEKIQTLKPNANNNTNPKLSDIVHELGNISRRIPKTDVVDLVPENFTEKDLLMPESLEEESQERQPDYESQPIILTTESPTTRTNLYSSKYRGKSLNHKFSPLVFDINQYLPKLDPALLSEVSYKNEIKPSQQMAVYSDVLKSIHAAEESRQIPVVEKQNEDETTEQLENNEGSTEILETTTALPKNHKIVPMKRFKYKPIPIHEYARPFRVVSVSPKNKLSLYRTLLPKSMTVRPLRLTRNTKRVYIVRFNKPLKIKTKLKRFRRDLTDLEMEESESVPAYVAPPSRKQITYTEIMRTKPPKLENEDEDDEDIQPRKRIYDISGARSTERYVKPPRQTTPLSISRKRTESPPEEDTEEEEVKPTIDPKLLEAAPSKEDPSIPEYIFLINKFHILHPPTTTVKPETTTPATQLASESIQTSQPDFLQIINHLHDIKGTQTETTTKATVTVVEPTVPMKNSNPFISYEPVSEPFVQRSPNRNFDDDDQARIRNYSSKLRTSIDTSKYKTIERPTMKHPTADEEDNSKYKSIRRSTTSTTEDLPLVVSTSETSVTSTSLPPTSSTTESTTKPSTTTPEVSTFRKRLRTRTRSTTIASSASTRSEVTTTHPIFNRRRRPTTLRSTTQSSVSTTKYNPIESKRRHRLRLDVQKEVPVNHKPVYTPIDSTNSTEGHVKKRRIDSGVSEEDDYKSEDLKENKKSEFEIVAPLKHLDTKHGGNYKHIEDASPKEQLKQDSDIVTLTLEPNLAFDVNQLKETVPSTSLKLPIILPADRSQKRPKNGKAHLYPNMARLVNRLAVVTTTERVKTDKDVSTEPTNEDAKPKFIKDPSRRLYFYAKL